MLLKLGIWVFHKMLAALWQVIAIRDGDTCITILINLFAFLRFLHYLNAEKSKEQANRLYFS